MTRRPRPVEWIALTISTVLANLAALVLRLRTPNPNRRNCRKGDRRG